jgi:HK97 family phage portal protein
MDKFSFTESLVSYLMLDGNVWIIPFPPGAPQPQALWVVSKNNMMAITDRNTNQLLGWTYNPQGDQGLVTNYQRGHPLKPEEVIHIWFWNPYDPIMGMAPLEAGEMTITTDYKSARYQQLFFDQGASASGVLATDHKLGDKQFRRTKEQFKEKHESYKKAHQTVVLEQGLKYTQTGLTQKDMEFYNLRKFDAGRIYQIFGMKKSIVSETEDINYATSREQRKEWWQGTNIPIMKLIASAINFWLEDRNVMVYYDISKVPALQETIADKTKTARDLWMIGFTRNEINERLALGFGNQPWGDYWYMPINLQPVKNGGEEGEIEEESLGQWVRNGLIPVGKKALPLTNSSVKDEGKVEIVKDEFDKKGEILWRNAITRSSPLETRFSSKMRKIFFKMRKKTLRLFFEGTKTPSDVINEPYLEESSALEKAVAPLYALSLTTGIETLADEIGIGITFDLQDPLAISFLGEKRIRIKGTLSTVKKQVLAEIQEGLSRGEDFNTIANRIRTVFNIADSRAKIIASTEIFSGVNFSRYVGIQRSGFSEEQWFTALDERVRKMHLDLHGAKHKVGELWVFKDGTYVRFPNDPKGPAHQIISCRCLVLVVPGTHYLD